MGTYVPVLAADRVEDALVVLRVCLWPMREMTFKLGFTSALALLAPLPAVCAGHTTRVAAHTVRPAAHAARAHEAAAPLTGRHTAHAEPLESAHSSFHHGAEAKSAHGREVVVAARGRNGRETLATFNRKANKPLTRAEKRAQAAEDARAEREDAAAARKASKLTLAGRHRSQQEEEPLPRSIATHSRPEPRIVPAQRAAPAPERLASLNDNTMPAPDEQRAAPLPPVNVHHDRKVHYTAGGEAEDATPTPPAAVAPRQAAPSRPAPRPAPASAPLSGVSHPDEMDEQAPMTSARPAPAPIAQLAPATTTQNRIQQVYGIGRQAGQNQAGQTQAGQSAAGQRQAALTAPQRASIGTPLIMAATNATPTSTIMTSRQPLPPPSLEPQVQPSAAVRARLPSIEDEAAETQLVPSLLYAHGQLVMPPALKGSREILVHQNTEADREGLTRIRDDEDLMRMRASRQLVALPDQTGLAVDDRLPANRRFARPWTAHFLADLARAHYAHFHTDLIVTSAVRTVEVQQRLIRTNGNAAPAEGETASPHLTGQAVDLGKKGLSMTEIAWMRGYLLPLVQQGKVDVEEEFQQACFHISVYRAYVPGASGSGAPPAISNHRSAASSLASALPTR